MLALVFDDSFPPSFDLADPWPKRPEWWNGKRYIGPEFDDLSRPATWATRVIMPAPDKDNKKRAGRPRVELREEFRDEWYMSVEHPQLFVHSRIRGKLYEPRVFNRLVAPFSDVDDVEKLVEKDFSTHADGLAYRPSTFADYRRILNDRGRRIINTFKPSNIFPVAGNCQLFLEFMEYLIPDETDRGHVARWCATLIEAAFSAEVVPLWAN